jgi:hypothetical protein
MTVSRELARYKLDLVVMQEVRWVGDGTEPAGEYTFFYGKGNENQELGTGFLCIRESYQQLSGLSLCDRMSYIILRGRWCHIIVLNVHAPTENKTADVKDSFYEEFEHVFDKFSKYHMKILFVDFNAKVGREEIFKPTTGNESLHEISNDNGVRLVNFATSKNLGVKSTMLPHGNIHKYTWTSPDGKTHNQIDCILVDRRRHSSVFDVRSFRAVDCDTDHYLVVAKVRERLAVNKQRSQRFDMERFNLKKLNEVWGKEQFRVEVSNRFAALEDLDTEVEINSAWETIRENNKISAKKILSYFEMKTHKLWFGEECSTLLDQRKQAKLQWLQDPSKINGDNLNNIRLETADISGIKREKSERQN